MGRWHLLIVLLTPEERRTTSPGSFQNHATNTSSPQLALSRVNCSLPITNNEYGRSLTVIFSNTAFVQLNGQAIQWLPINGLPSLSLDFWGTTGYFLRRRNTPFWCMTPKGRAVHLVFTLLCIGNWRLEFLAGWNGAICHCGKSALKKGFLRERHHTWIPSMLQELQRKWREP